MQLYILTPIFVYAYHKSRKLGHLLTLAAIGSCLAIRYFYPNPKEEANRFLHYRMAPYFVGLLFSQLDDFFAKRKYLCNLLLFTPFLMIPLYFYYLSLLLGRVTRPRNYI